MGALEPVKEIRSHELCLVFEVTAPTQEIASSIAGIVRHQALHLPIPEWSGLITALALPYNPRTRPRRGVPLQRQPRRRARRSVRDVSDGADRRRTARRVEGARVMSKLARARASHPQQERRAVRAHVRHHVRRRGRLRARAATRARSRAKRIARDLRPAGRARCSSFYCDTRCAIKASIPRPTIQGDRLRQRRPRRTAVRAADGHRNSLKREELDR